MITSEAKIERAPVAGFAPYQQQLPAVGGHGDLAVGVEFDVGPRPFHRPAGLAQGAKTIGHLIAGGKDPRQPEELGKGAGGIGISAAVDQVHFYNRFVTPLGRPRRFDTRFFIAAAPETQRGEHDAKETVDSIWISPEEALARNRDKEFDLMNVTRIQLEWLSEYANKQAVLDMAEAQEEFVVRRPVLPPGA